MAQEGAAEVGGETGTLEPECLGGLHLQPMHRLAHPSWTVWTSEDAEGTALVAFPSSGTMSQKGHLPLEVREDLWQTGNHN